ncbi:MAG: helix-turn-helix domain-containing protein, partial [Caldilineaceae bacterium]|nr:helix-turn-helix domain-containing protein [Caldilineaceae bacterium]
MFNLTSSTPKTWQTVSRQADRVNAEQNVYTQPSPSAHSVRDLGGVLRERRDAMGASLAEVETATRIRQKYLAALESDDWHLLPG